MVVDDVARLEVIVNGIDGEVASKRVVNQILAVSLAEILTLGNTRLPLQAYIHSLIGHHVGTHATLMLSLGNLHFASLCLVGVGHDSHQLVGCSIGREVHVVELLAHHTVTHGTAVDVSRMA